MATLAYLNSWSCVAIPSNTWFIKLRCLSIPSTERLKFKTFNISVPLKVSFSILRGSNSPSAMEVHTEVLCITGETGEWANQNTLDGLGFLFVWLGFFMIHIFDHLKKSTKYLGLAKITSYCPNGYFLWNRFFHHLNCKAWLVHMFCLSFHKILQ